MVVDSSSEGQPQSREFLDANSNLPLTCSSLKLLKPNYDVVNQQLPLEATPIPFEEASLPVGLYQPLHSARGQDVYSISVLPEEVDDAHCPSSLAFLSILEMKSEEVYSPCIIDIPVENGNSILSESYEEGIESCKSGNLITRVLWRQASLKTVGRLVQTLMNLSTTRDKSVAEKVHDMPSNRWRKYKRVASFDSRKVALLFSILSSFGTLVLIYLTLRVRQRGDGFVLI